MTHIMVDLETWGTTPGCAIRSIGACVFDPLTGEIGAEFYRNITDESCLLMGLIQNPSTVAWWADQSEEASAALRVSQVQVWGALSDFSAWYAAHGGQEVWSYGANADVPWLEAGYAACALKHPWHYRSPRCARTVLDLAGVEVNRDKGTHHYALDDARNQADAVAVAYGRLGLVFRVGQAVA